MYVKLSTLAAYLDQSEYSLFGNPEQLIRAVHLYQSNTPLVPECLYLADKNTFSSNAPDTDACVMVYQGNTASQESGFSDFVNRIYDTFLCIAASPDRITERISVLARCHGVQQLLDAGHELLRRGILLSNMNYQLVAASTETPKDQMIWRSALSFGELPMNLVTSKPWMSTWQEALNTSLPALVQSTSQHDPVFLYPIADSEDSIGMLVVDAAKGALSAFEQEIVIILGRFLAPEMKKREEYRASTRSALDHFFIFLLQGNTYSDIAMSQRVATLSWRPGAYMRIMTFHSDYYENPGSFITYSDVIRDIPKYGSDQAMFFEGDVVLLQCSEKPFSANSPATQEILQFAESRHLLVGVSRAFQSLQHIRQGYLQARDALDLGAILNPKVGVYWYEEYADYRLLQLCAKNIDLREFCHPGLLKLFESDQKGNSSYIETLKTYLENQRSISKTAKLLHIHRNTVTYRIDQCLAMCNTDLDKRQNLLHILLSIHILDLLAMNPENIFRMEPVPAKIDDLHAVPPNI